MPVEKIDTLVVGGGQAGLAMSDHLRRAGVGHLVLERHRIAERWRSERWDTLVMNGPAWHDRFPGLTFDDVDPDGFPDKHSVVRYFERFAQHIDAPIRCGVEVHELHKIDGRRGFRAETSQGPVEAVNVVAATGPFQRPVIPQIVPADAGIAQIHSSAYRNPAQMPPGAVLVVGAGSSGGQIADELLRAGREVYLSVGPHDRPPRSYRGRDYCWWLGVLGLWDVAAATPGTEHVTISVSGAHGGQTVDFRRFAARGMTLLGMADSYDKGTMRFRADVAENVAHGDANYLSVLDQADAYVRRHGLDLPDEPEARVFPPTPDCVLQPCLALDLEQAGVTSIIWATGYRFDYGWLKADVFDEAGRPVHQRGVTAEPGLYFLGLPWQSRRGSAFVWGVWHDARYIADQIGIQSAYRDHHLAAANRTTV
ncbi:MAG: NAD(P)/FAD-dependent oxidoreductase [Rhodobacteraceae bacterium]|nr:NAD(P)/FAD-dependent oxidoreductase [Paracoccaceae bacterium]